MESVELKFNSLLYRLLVASAVVSLTSCITQDDPEGELPAVKRIETDFVEIEPTIAPMTFTYPGIMEGRVNVDIRSQATGYLESIFVREGDFVRKGQPLFKVKGDVLQEQIRISEATLASSLATLENAKTELDKLTPFMEGRSVSDEQLRAARGNYALASAQVAQSKANLRLARLNAGFSVISAPVSGYIGRIPNRVGNLITADDANPLTTLSEIDEVFVYFSLSEVEYLKYRKGSETRDTVYLQLADGTTYDQMGRIEMAAGGVDAATGSVTVKAVFPNPDRLLRSGGSGRVMISRSVPNTLLIPKRCVKDIQDKFFVYKLEADNKVAMTPIEVAGSSGSNYLVRLGLTSGDQIAVSQLDALMDGARVKPRLAKVYQQNR